MTPPVAASSGSAARARHRSVAHQRQRRCRERQTATHRTRIRRAPGRAARSGSVARLQPRAADPSSSNRSTAFSRSSPGPESTVLGRCRRRPTPRGSPRRPARPAWRRRTPRPIRRHREAAEQPAAFGEQPCAVGEAEHPPHARGRVLADTVAEHHVGFDAPRLPQPGQAHLHGEEGRLRKRRVPHASPALPPVSRSVANITSTASSPRGSVLDRVRALKHGLGEDRLALEQFAGHAGVLTALTGEQPRRRRVVDVLAADDAGRRRFSASSARRRGRPRSSRPPGRRDVRSATGRPRGEAHRGQVGIRVHDSTHVS